MAVATDLQLGSGKLYLLKVTNETAIPAASTICVDANLVGYIKGGATITYTPKTYDVKDDIGMVNEHFITSEEVTFKSGLLTWDMDTLKKLINNESAITAQGITGIEIGAAGFTRMDKYVVYFQAVASNNGKVRSFGFIGTCDAGLNLQYMPEKETTVDANFKACADSAGHLLRIEEPST